MDSRLKRFTRRVLPSRVYETVREAVKTPRLDEAEERLEWATALLARHLYGEQLRTGDDLRIRDFELGINSQNGVDGILPFLYATIGATDRRFVEFGMGDGRVCNTANLSRQWGWSGLLMDFSGKRVKTARRTYTKWLGDDAARIQIRQAKVTAENINSILREEGFTGQIDLLSIDIDGNDYWVWKSIDVISPRLVVIEYNSSFGPEDSVTIPYDPDFDVRDAHPSRIYHGASLMALAKLGADKGYDLVGCDSRGVNACFVQQGLIQPPLCPRTAQDAGVTSRQRRSMDQAHQEVLLRGFPTVSV